MKRNIHAFRGHDVVAVEGHNVKLGRGGIREIEFFVQTSSSLPAGAIQPALLPHPQRAGCAGAGPLDRLACARPACGSL